MSRQAINLSRQDFIDKFQATFGSGSPALESDPQGNLILKTNLRFNPTNRDMIVNEEYEKANVKPKA